MNPPVSANEREKRGMVMADILAQVSHTFGVPVEDMRGKSRKKPIARARHAAVWIAHQNPRLSFLDIGNALNRHHTVAMHSAEQCKQIMTRDWHYSQCVNRVLSKLRSGDIDRPHNRREQCPAERFMNRSIERGSRDLLNAIMEARAA